MGARENVDHYELNDEVRLHNFDILKEFSDEKEDEDSDSKESDKEDDPDKKDDLAKKDGNKQFEEYFDTIVMNPPFGTKNNAGIDMKLLKCATRALKKASTSKYIEKTIKEWGDEFCGELLQIIQFDLPNTYNFHKKKNAITEVVLVKVTRR